MHIIYWLWIWGATLNVARNCSEFFLVFFLRSRLLQTCKQLYVMLYTLMLNSIPLVFPVVQVFCNIIHVRTEAEKHLIVCQSCSSVFHIRINNTCSFCRSEAEKQGLERELRSITHQNSMETATSPKHLVNGGYLSKTLSNCENYFYMFQWSCFILRCWLNIGDSKIHAYMCCQVVIQQEHT